MTLFIVTVTERYALVSQDTFVTREQDVSREDVDTSLTGNMATATRTAYVGGGRTELFPPLTFASKMAFLPHLHAIVGGSGDFGLQAMWTGVLNMAGGLRNIDGIACIAQSGLARLAKRIGEPGPLTVFHVGWSERAGKPRAFIQSSQDGFALVELTIGHSISPAPNFNDPSAATMCLLWKPAATGEDITATREFHKVVATNQHRAYRSGLFRQGAGIGGQLQTARVEHRGLSVERTLSFPGFTEAVNELSNAVERHIDGMMAKIGAMA